MSPDVVEHEREIYGSLAFIGDMGGVFSGLVSLMSALLTFLSMFMINHRDLAVIKEIFRDGGDDHPDPEICKETGHTNIKISSFAVPICMSRRNKLLFKDGSERI